jgi:HD-GYP domain-containing protein (c-di-GMP phosphodiesterase class II)
MSSSPQIKYYDQKAEGASDLIEDFENLQMVLKQSFLFTEYGFNQIDNSSFNLLFEQITLTFLSPEKWRTMAPAEIVSQNDQNTPQIKICTGTEEDLMRYEDFITSNNLLTLCFPINEMQLLQLVRSLFSVERTLIQTAETRKTASETGSFIHSLLANIRSMNTTNESSQLFILILYYARRICHADAGGIYTIHQKPNELAKTARLHLFTIYSIRGLATNESVEFLLDDRTLIGKSSQSARSIHIADTAYQPVEIDAPTKKLIEQGSEQNLYRIKSVLAVPIFDIGNQMIGMIQLFNRKKKEFAVLDKPESFESQVTSFSERDIDGVEIIARQAGISLENALLREEKDKLFNNFVHAAVGAIEQRDPTTSGHSLRVARLTVSTAELINKITAGRFKNVNFDKQQLKEIEYASLLHDFGKIGVREEVLVKAKKLYPWQLDLIVERFNHARSSAERDYLRSVLNYLENPDKYPPGFDFSTLTKVRDSAQQELTRFLEFILKCNEPTVLEQSGFEMLKDIASMSFQEHGKRMRPLLTDSEIKALSISRGSLTQQEFNEIQSHVTHTLVFLEKIPWGSQFPSLSQIASKHHEKLDGTGYPLSCGETEIPIQTRMMTISDIFDALTASDRPYKKAVPVDKALQILEIEVKSGKCDRELFQIFVEAKIYESVLTGA